MKTNTNSVTPTTDQTPTTNNLPVDNSELPTYNFGSSDSESDNMSQLSRTKDDINTKIKLQISQLRSIKKRVSDLEDKQTDNIMNLDEKMNPQILRQNTIYIAQLEALEITAKEDK